MTAVSLMAGCSSKDRLSQLLPVGSVAACLDASGWSVSQKAKDLGFVASDAPIGGIYANDGTNGVTLAFGEDAQTAELLESEYRAWAPAIIVGVEGYFGHTANVAWAWDKVPTRNERMTIEDCLA